MNTNLNTGWFGQEGRGGRSTKVHVLKSDGTCLCGYKPHTSFKFQWCGHGVVLEYIDCTECSKKSKQLFQICDKGGSHERSSRKVI